MTEAYFHGCCPRTLEDIGDEQGREYRIHQAQKKNSSLACGGGGGNLTGLNRRDNEDGRIMEVYPTMSHPGHDTLK